MRALGAAERQWLLAALDLRAPLPPPAALDWPALIAAARGGKILPLLSQRALAEQGASLAADAREALRESLQETAVYNTRLLAELARIAERLRASGIACVALKGTALMARHYPHFAMRHAVDVDLLVDPDRFGTAVALLHEAGYEDAPHTRRMAPDGRTLAETSPALRYAGTPLLSPSGVSVDLHHRVPISGFDRRGGFRGWLARAQPAEIHGATVAISHPVDLALHLCEHFAIHHYAEPADVPRLLCDLRALFPDDPPWPELAEGPLAQRASLALARALYEAAFGGSTYGERCRPVAELLRRAAVADPALNLPLAQLSNLRGHASRIAYDLVRRPRYALRTWMPTREYLAARYGLHPRSPRIYPLYVTRLWVAATRPLWSWR